MSWLLRFRCFEPYINANVRLLEFTHFAYFTIRFAKVSVVEVLVVDTKGIIRFQSLDADWECKVLQEVSLDIDVGALMLFLFDVDCCLDTG